jgi:5-methylcytosine-specific restriction protein B
MTPGDRIALKATFVRKRGLPFDVGGRPVSVMRIKATGTILENLNDGQKVRVAWDPPFEPRDWYFYTYRTTIVEADAESEAGSRLVDFVFRGATQDYAWWLARPYWVEKYGAKPAMAAAASSVVHPEFEEDDIVEIEEEQTYTVDDIIADGCFLGKEELGEILGRWRSKKNLVLQCPPGTGKTWLAKRLGFALVGSEDRETT